MDDAFLAEMSQALTRLRAELEQVDDTAETSAQTVELDQQRVGRLSRMDAMQAQAMAQASGRRREETLRGIAAALARIESGDYGYCQSCEKAVLENRLRFDPTAALCIDCASAVEDASR